MFVLVFYLFQMTQSIITYYFGNVMSFDYAVDSSINCGSSNSYTKTITFSDSFANIPQVVILPYKWDMTKAYCDYSITSLTPSTTSKNICQKMKDFIMTIKCTNQRMYGLRFRYAAFDDSRLEVINSFNKNMAGQGSQTYQFSHSNPNALQGFVSIVSFGFQGSMGFSLDIQSVSKSAVTLAFTSNGTHLYLLGFQIILGPAEAFTKSALITSTTLSTSVTYNSGSITLQTGQKLLIPQQAFIYLSSNTEYLRVDQSYTESGSAVSYVKQCWSGSWMNSISWYQIMLNTQNTKTLEPMFYKKMRISEAYNLNLEFNPFKLAFSELTNTYTGVQSDSIIIDNTIQTLTIILSVNCLGNRSITVSILKCPQCNPMNLNWKQNCYGAINQITYYFTFFQAEPIYKRISVSLTASSAIVTQTVYNEVKTDHMLLQVLIANI